MGDKNKPVDTELCTTADNILIDCEKMRFVLESLTGLSVEGGIIREDLIGLLEFVDIHQLEQLTIERRKVERDSLSPLSINNFQRDFNSKLKKRNNFDFSCVSISNDIVIQ